jgi:Uncharacterized protein conserved in bacteria
MNLPKPLLYFLLAFLLLSCNDAVDSPYPAISFQKIATMPGIGRSSAVAFAVNGKGYVTLGRDGNPADSLKDCWQYDPTLSSWTKKANFPGFPRVKATTAVVNGKAYVGLGFNRYKNSYSIGGGILKDFWMYDPALNTWTQKANFPSLATDACVSFVMDNCIYVGEGFNDFDFTNEFWKYDPEQDAWSQLKDFPDYARAGAVLCTDGTRVFFGTGFRSWNFNDWWEYFPKTDRWEKRKSMPDNGRVNAVSLSVAGRFFVSTGRHFAGDLTGGRVLSDIMEYDAIRNVWYKRGNIPGGGRENAIAFVINGKGYIGFGEDDKGVLNDFWSFEP